MPRPVVTSDPLPPRTSSGQVVFLHKRHPGVSKLGNRALDALWGKDDFGAKQKASAAERIQTRGEDGKD